MRYSIAVLLLAGMVGCGDFEEAMNAEREPAAPAGVLPVDQMDGDIDNMAGGNGQANGGGAAQPAAPPKDPSSIIGKTTAKVVDKKAEMAKNPNLVVVENKVSGNDPITVAASAYISATSKISVLTFESNMKTWKALNNNQNPSYAEFQKMAKDLSYAALPPFQMYGYDSDTGSLVVLEDKADKKRRYEAAGIPFEG
ncbi:MAG: hypothetical protein HOL01_21950 [Planctomycetaceae bacterium]|jgi:hypothetical protein|nr:hypothetical protein [Planctomycetaceae bacterium]MBT6485405.1 hypothetical protein [Planctomycetaceae bacterium]MBT6497201.1 hypothetical protein [Planctomycetaceae bacterium]